MNLFEVLQYEVSCDSDNKLLDGTGYYKIYLPSEINSADFWSVIVYDNLSHLLIRISKAWSSVFKNCKNLVTNNDASVDLLFGPEAPESKINNRIQTIPDNHWFLIFRLYYQRGSLLNNDWKPGKIEEILNNAIS